MMSFMGSIGSMLMGSGLEKLQKQYMYSVQTWWLSHNDELYGQHWFYVNGIWIREALETVYVQYVDLVAFPQ